MKLFHFSKHTPEISTFEQPIPPLYSVVEVVINGGSCGRYVLPVGDWLLVARTEENDGVPSIVKVLADWLEERGFAEAGNELRNFK